MYVFHHFSFYLETMTTDDVMHIYEISNLFLLRFLSFGRCEDWAICFPFLVGQKLSEFSTDIEYAEIRVRKKIEEETTLNPFNFHFTFHNSYTHASESVRICLKSGKIFFQRLFVQPFLAKMTISSQLIVPILPHPMDREENENLHISIHT